MTTAKGLPIVLGAKPSDACIPRLAAILAINEIDKLLAQASLYLASDEDLSSDRLSKLLFSAIKLLCSLSLRPKKQDYDEPCLFEDDKLSVEENVEITMSLKRALDTIKKFRALKYRDHEVSAEQREQMIECLTIVERIFTRLPAFSDDVLEDEVSAILGK